MATTKRIQKGTVAQLKNQGTPMTAPVKPKTPKAPAMPKVKAGKGKC